MPPAAAEPVKEPLVPDEAQQSAPAAAMSPPETKAVEAERPGTASGAGQEHQQSASTAVLEEPKTAGSEHQNQNPSQDIRQSERSEAHPAQAQAPGVSNHLRQAPRQEIAQDGGGGVGEKEARALVTALWRRTATAKEFVAAVTGAGWVLARGDRHNLILIDPKGGAHSLRSSIDSVSAKVIRKRMARLDPTSLPRVNEAQAKVRAVIAQEQARTAAERIPPVAVERAPDAVHAREQMSTTIEHLPPTVTERAPPTVAEHADQASKRHVQQGGHPGVGLQHARPKEAQGFDLLGRLDRAALTIPQNLKALVGLAKPVRLHGARAGLAPALATKFDGQVGALAYLILLLCYPCIATTAATARETNHRWTSFMVFWTMSLGYGAAVLFYQIGTFALHPYLSAAWIVGVVTYFVVLGAASSYVGPQPRTVPANPNGSSTGTCCG